MQLKFKQLNNNKNKIMIIIGVGVGTGGGGGLQPLPHWTLSRVKFEACQIVSQLAVFHNNVVMKFLFVPTTSLPSPPPPPP